MHLIIMLIIFVGLAAIIVWVVDWVSVGTSTPMTAACIGPEAAVDVLKDALSY